MAETLEPPSHRLYLVCARKLSQEPYTILLHLVAKKAVKRKLRIFTFAIVWSTWHVATEKLNQICHKSSSETPVWVFDFLSTNKAKVRFEISNPPVSWQPIGQRKEKLEHIIIICCFMDTKMQCGKIKELSIIFLSTSPSETAQLYLGPKAEIKARQLFFTDILTF